MKKISNETLGRLSIESFKEIEKAPFCVILDNVRSQHNVGSVFRTSDAFRVEEIFLCGITATPPHREIQKTALGATETVAWRYCPETSDAISMLKEQGYLIFAVEQAEGSMMLEDFIFPENKKIAIIFGNEVDGVDDHIMDMVDGSIEIPQYGTKHSLNISVSAGIVIHALWNKISVNNLN